MDLYNDNLDVKELLKRIRILPLINLNYINEDF